MLVPGTCAGIPPNVNILPVNIERLGEGGLATAAASQIKGQINKSEHVPHWQNKRHPLPWLRVLTEP